MRFRKLRIAWSVFWGVACVLLIALWVRSYWWVDGFGVPLTSKYSLGVGSNPGCIGLALDPSGQFSGRHLTQPTEVWLRAVRGAELFNISRVWGTFYAGEFGYLAPDWFVLLIVATLATAPWLRWRYSLRTLLIATTLVAVVLGSIVWAVNR